MKDDHNKNFFETKKKSGYLKNHGYSYEINVEFEIFYCGFT